MLWTTISWHMIEIWPTKQAKAWPCNSYLLSTFSEVICWRPGHAFLKGNFSSPPPGRLKKYVANIYFEASIYVAAAIYTLVWASWTPWPSANVECNCWEDSYKPQVLHRGESLFSLDVILDMLWGIIGYCIFFHVSERGGHWSNFKFVLGAGIWVCWSLFVWWAFQARLVPITCTKLTNGTLIISQVHDWEAALEVGHREIYSCKSYGKSYLNFLSFSYSFY